MFRELYCYDIRDIAADWAAADYYRWLRDLERWESLPDISKAAMGYPPPPFLGNRTGDSSTGLSQMFASTALKALNYSIENGIVTKDELGIPDDMELDYSNLETREYIWNRLHNDPEFNIEVMVLEINHCAGDPYYGGPGHTDFANYTQEDVESMFARYNGTNAAAQQYGVEVADICDIFIEYSDFFDGTFFDDWM